MEALLFYGFSGIAVVASLGVLLQARNTVYAALSLVVAMLALAVLFVMLQAEFMGVLQVLVYAGAIVVLFLFVIMLLNVQGGNMGGDSQPLVKLVGTGVVLAATVKLAALVAGASRPSAAVDTDFGTVAFVARPLYTDYMLVFQAVGVLLLAGIVAAVMLAKREVD